MTRVIPIAARRWWKRSALLALIPLLAATALLSTSEPALAVPTATLTVSANGVTEGTDVVFTVNFNHSVAGDTFVMLTWSHGQTNASDFGQDSGRYTNCIFPNCQQPSPYALLVKQHTTSASWTIPVLEDNVDEGPERFTVALHSTQLQLWGTVVIASGQPSSQTVTIYDHQFPATPNDDGSFTVAADWPLVPSGLSSGDRFRLIFATSKSSGVNATRIDRYNSYVDELAKAAALADYCCTITFKALASTATVDARDNLDLWDSAANQWSDTSSNIPTYWIGTSYQVASSYSGLFSSDGWSNEAQARSEDGTTRTTQYKPNRIATGTNQDGQATSTGVLRSLGAAVGNQWIEAGLLGSTVDGTTPISGSWRTVGGGWLHLWTLSYFYGVSPVLVVE